MSEPTSTPTRRRAGPVRLVLFVLLIAVVAGSQLLGLRSVWTLADVADSFDVANGVSATTADAQRDSLRLRLLLEQEDVDLEGVQLQTSLLRGELDQLSAGGLEPDARARLQVAVVATDDVSEEVARLLADRQRTGSPSRLSDRELLLAAPAVHGDAAVAEQSVRTLSSDLEHDLFSKGVRTVERRRDEQVVSVVVAVTAIALAVSLALSLRRGSRRDFADAVRRLAAEQQVRTAAQEAAARTERRFSALVRQGDDMILVLSPGGGEDAAAGPGAADRITFASPAAARLLGLHDSSHLIGESFVDLVAEGERCVATDALSRARARDGRAVRVDVRLRDRSPAGHVAADEDHVWLSVVLTDLTRDPAVGGVVVNAHDITDRVVRASMLEHLAYHDRVSGLANRLGAERHLDGAGPDERFSIAVLDLDRFGTLNEEAGQTYADEVLRAVADALELRSFPSALVAHFGADVFAVITPSFVAPPAEVARRVAQVLHAGVDVRGRHLRFAAGIGAVGSAGMRGNDALRLAESAMHEAKRQGAGSVVVHDERRLEQQRQRTRLLEGLQGAAAADELRLHHQPLVNLRTGEVTGTEALLRWQRGDVLVPPVDFVPLAEETGLIVPLGSWVLAQACADVARLGRAGRGDLRVNVNVSPRQLAEDGFVAHVADVMASLGTDPARIVLELTESAVVEDPDRVAGMLADLRAAGHAIALDDFGTGYSSLSHLMRLPVDTVKLDRSFVADVDTSPRTRQMVRAVVQVCHDLGLSVTVEGIENAHQLDAVREAGCDTVQGFLLARPMPFEALVGLVVPCGRTLVPWPQPPHPAAAVDAGVPSRAG